MSRKDGAIAGLLIMIVILLTLLFLQRRELPRAPSDVQPAAELSVRPGSSATISPIATAIETSVPRVRATAMPQPSFTQTATPTPSATTTAFPTPRQIALQVTLEKICVHVTGDLPFSRADIYFSVWLIDPKGVSHLIQEVPQVSARKHPASVDCATPLMLDSSQTINVPARENSCVRIEGEFWNANRLIEDIQVGVLNDVVCYRNSRWSPLGVRAQHFTGGAADWELFYRVEEK